MKEKPILFSGAMVRAILDGRKSVTRRVVKPQPYYIESSGRWVYSIPKPRIPKGCTDRVCDASRRWYEYLLRDQWEYKPGDRLWVRETWKYADWTEEGEPYIRYRADGKRKIMWPDDEHDEQVQQIWADLSDPSNYNIDNVAADRPWRPSIHMPRWASRITLEVTGVRVERLQEISEEGAIAEGIGPFANSLTIDCETESPKRVFAGLWDSINGARSPWSSNPWCWVVSFRRSDV